MAKSVYDSEEISLQDGREVVLTPLPIGKLRRFMKAWEKFSDIENEEQAFDIYINCCGIALEKAVLEDFPNAKDSENFISDEYREYLEDVLDMDTIYKILDVCGGLKLNDPKLLEAAEAMVAQQQAQAQGGKN